MAAAAEEKNDLRAVEMVAVSVPSRSPPQTSTARPCCGCCLQVSALIAKNCRQKSRHKLRFGCELFCPLLFIVLFGWMFTQFEFRTTCAYYPAFNNGGTLPGYYSGGDFVRLAGGWVGQHSGNSHSEKMQDVNAVLMGLWARDWSIAVYPDSPAVQQFLSRMDSVYPGFNPSEAFPADVLEAVPQLSMTRYPKFSDVVATFKDEAALHAHVGAVDYHNRRFVAHALKFDSVGVENNKWKYTIRNNRTMSADSAAQHVDQTVRNDRGWSNTGGWDGPTEDQPSMYIQGEQWRLTRTQSFSPNGDDDDEPPLPWWEIPCTAASGKDNFDAYGAAIRANSDYGGGPPPFSFALLQLTIDKAIINQAAPSLSTPGAFLSRAMSQQPSSSGWSDAERNGRSAAQWLRRDLDKLEMDCNFRTAKRALDSPGGGSERNGGHTGQDDVVVWANWANTMDDAKWALLAEKYTAFQKYQTMAPQSLAVGNFPEPRYNVNEFFEQKQIMDMIAIFFVFAFCVPVKNLLNKLVFEHESGIKEGMKMMGLHDSALVASWLLTYIVQFLVTMALVAYVCKESFFGHSDLLLLFSFFACFAFSIVSFCYMVHGFFSKATTAGVLGALAFFGTFFTYFVAKDDSPEMEMRLISLTGTAAFGFGLDVISLFEGSKIGFTFDTLSAAGTRHLSMQDVCAHMLLDGVIYIVLGYYIERVIPKERMVPLKPWFFLLPSYWCPRRAAANAQRQAAKSRVRSVGSARDLALAGGEKDNRVDALADVERGVVDDDDVGNERGGDHYDSHFEQLTAVQEEKLRSQHCLHIENLRKVFQTADGTEKIAVAGLNAAMFEGEIYVLLGHNGAGKTTTISMLCGLLSPSGGRATCFGRDVQTEMASIRNFIGVCPQHNVLYDDLTCWEHLMLYCRIKLVPRARRAAMCTELLQDVALTEKTNMLTPTLSGGQKRKLCLAIALCGDSKVLYLDEPTSGMDVFAQRSTWNLLQKAKAGRVIILTTHSMEEADVLGDRIGIMANGKMVCSGSPLFLKNLYGVGYCLTTTRDGSAGDSELEATIKEMVPEAKKLSEHGKELAFQLPLSAACAFEPLFTALAQLKEQNKLDSFNVSVTTMQEVFLRSAVEAERSVAQQKEDKALKRKLSRRMSSKSVLALEAAEAEAKLGDGAAAEAKHQRAAEAEEALRARLARLNRCMVCTHFTALLVKRWHNVKRDIKAIIFQVFIPIVALSLGIWLISNVPTSYPSASPSTRDFNPSLPSPLGESTHVPFWEQSSISEAATLLNSVANQVSGFSLNAATGQSETSDEGMIGRHHGEFCYQMEPEKTDEWYAQHMPGEDQCNPTSARFKTIAGACGDCNSIVAMPCNSAEHGNLSPGEMICFNAFDVQAMNNLGNYGYSQDELVAMVKAPCSGAGAAQGGACSFRVEDKNFDTTQFLQGNGIAISKVRYAELVAIDAAARTRDQANELNTMLTCAKNKELLRVRERDASSTYGSLTLLGGSSAQDKFYDAILQFNSSSVAGPLVMLNLLDTSLLRVLGGDEGASIEVTNHPLPPTAMEIAFYTQVTGFFVVFVIGIAWAFIPAAAAEYIVHERFHGVKHQQLVSGVSLPAYWLSNYVWDCIQYAVPAAAAIAIFQFWDIEAYTREEGNNFECTIALIALYGPASIGHAYLVSRFFAKPATAVNSILVMNVLLVIFIISIFIARLTGQDTCDKAELGRRYFFLTFPGYAFVEGLLRISLADVMFSCDEMHNPLVVPVPTPAGEHADAWKTIVTGEGINYLACEAALYPLLCVLLELFNSAPVLRRTLCGWREPRTVDKPVNSEDSDVRAMREKMQRGGPPVGVADAMVEVRGLRKVYRVKSASGGGRLVKAAVKDTWFRIPQGECFGLLGTNGAGKSTTFKMLSGDVLPSAGTARLGGRDVMSQQVAVRRLIGYCPQHNALLPRLTVVEHLYLFARIKGVTKGVDQIVKDLLKSMDLVEFAGKRSSSLSGGNKRKLCVAIALIGNPPVIFLDEPSAGMDPVAKRFMWDLISRMSTSNQTEAEKLTIILTTHSMEECSALCSKICIMVDGRLQCLGSEQHLKDKFGQGYQLDIKLREPEPEELAASIKLFSAQCDEFGHVPAASVRSACASLGAASRASQLIDPDFDAKKKKKKVVGEKKEQEGGGGDVVGSGWLLKEALEKDGFLEATALARWWIRDDWTSSVSTFIVDNLSSQADLQEQHGGTLRFNVDGLPAGDTQGDSTHEESNFRVSRRSIRERAGLEAKRQAAIAAANADGGAVEKVSLARMFGVLEGSKTVLNIGEYALGQTSLEQIFISFAKQQEADAGNVRGMN